MSLISLRFKLPRMKKFIPVTSKPKPSSCKQSTTHWSLGLLQSMKNPEEILEDDDLVVVLQDKYPKARFHYLVLPKKDILAVNKLTRDDLELLEHMESIGKKFADQQKDSEFLIGYHAVPSMQRLHMHVISTDFDSRCLKTKRHWNSFNTPYFIKSMDVRKRVEEDGCIEVDPKEKENLLKIDLKCHKCTFKPTSMSKLKQHLIEHISPK